MVEFSDINFKMNSNFGEVYRVLNFRDKDSQELSLVMTLVETDDYYSMDLVITIFPKGNPDGIEIRKYDLFNINEMYDESLKYSIPDTLQNYMRAIAYCLYDDPNYWELPIKEN